MTTFSYQLCATDGAARLGQVATAHGAFDTPAFMPVGTAGAVKAMTPENVASTGAQVVLGNTYHLMLRPGAKRAERLGGLHKFMNWPGPILTDSGGFQIMSLSQLRKLDEDGVAFQSHIDGSRHRLTPETSVDIQRSLDADITMVLDECPPLHIGKEAVAASTRLSMRWAERSRRAFAERPGYALFGINQGGLYEDLRHESAQILVDIGFDGYAIGGLAIGEGRQAMFHVLDFTVPLLPADKPRYLMGVGMPEDIIGAVMRGVDMFDCVLPTRSGRTAQAFTRMGRINIRNARHKDDPRPLDEACSCPACSGYSRAYLHHLIQAKEILGSILLTWHNLHYYQELMSGLRRAIGRGNLADYAAEVLEGYERGDVKAVRAFP